MTREEIKQDIRAYNTNRDDGQNPHIDIFIKEYKDRAEEDGITLLKMNLPSSLITFHPDKGILTDSNQVDDIEDIDTIITKAYVAKTRSVYGGVKKDNESGKYECLENGYYFSLEQFYDMLLLDKSKGYDIFGVYDFGVYNSETDSPSLLLRYGRLTSNLRFENLEEEIKNKWK